VRHYVRPSEREFGGPPLPGCTRQEPRRPSVHFLDEEDLIYVAIDVRLPVAHDVAGVVGLAAVFRRRLIGGLGLGARSAIRR
jgi:hypothetical protein